MTKIAINGFGRIGRGFVRAVYQNKQALGREGLEIVAINDLTTPANLAYLLKYDSVYGRAPFEVGARPRRSQGEVRVPTEASGRAEDNGALIIDGREIPVLAERDPSKLPWRDMQVDIVVEATGRFTDGKAARAHIGAGAKRVVITAPPKGEGAPVIMIGANEEKFGLPGEGSCDVTSNASCTTNAASPLIGILDEAIGIERALLNTTHAYTATQAIVDGSAADDFRRGRAGAINLAPSSTGAAKATALAYPQLAGKFDGIAVRVPVPAGSIVDITFVPKRPTTAEEVNNALRAAAGSDRWKRVFAVSDEPLVSTDILGLPYGAIADLTMTRVVDGTLVKVLAWYDNEMGYAHTLVEHVLEVAKRIS